MDSYLPATDDDVPADLLPIDSAMFANSSNSSDRRLDQEEFH